MVIFSVDNNIVLNVVNDYVSAVFSVTDHIKCCLREVIQKHASHVLSGATIIFAPPPANIRYGPER